MSVDIEQEQTYLLAKLPDDLSGWEMEFLADTYLPEDAENPQIRLRQRGETYFMTKKYPKVPGDLSVMIEETINLTKDEYNYFRSHLEGKYLAKNRYKKTIEGGVIEIDAYQDNLSPLIVMDIEWTTSAPTEEDLKEFDIKRNITQVHELAGGQMAGKTYEDIRQYVEE